jgi:hypothetical protein
MRAWLTAMSAGALLAPAVFAQPSGPLGLPAAQPETPAVTLTDMEKNCREGSRQACEDAERLRTRVASGLKGMREGSLGQARDIDAPPEGSATPGRR